ncbi:E3 ubiquitin-protein ligase cblA-like [Microplitis demolitor]|uniref:E3 ubiquitin-protein ligase cblA-like n=1 Tax=Microplitis demolitor TaxID=69319 RepID=UPI00235B6DA0|nr:E3 ubiquitin-protein ligase cblA-like [Microplitis demolitor]
MPHHHIAVRAGVAQRDLMVLGNDDDDDVDNGEADGLVNNDNEELVDNNGAGGLFNNDNEELIENAGIDHDGENNVAVAANIAYNGENNVQAADNIAYGEGNVVAADIANEDEGYEADAGDIVLHMPELQHDLVAVFDVAGNLCLLCNDRSINRYFLLCKHQVSCHECVENWRAVLIAENRRFKCPICRSPILHVANVTAAAA